MSAVSMAAPHPQTSTISFMPREHGATAMLLIPFFSAAILARGVRWAEAVALLAAFVTFAAKDPLLVLARQRWIWKQRRPETDAAKSWLMGEALTLAVCGLLLATAWPLWMLTAAGIGALGFSALAVYVNVRNRQRSTVFQIMSAVALSSTSMAACLSATGAIKPWCWWLWLLCGLQATAGILVVHARLEARIAARRSQPVDRTWRRPAFCAAVALLGASGVAAVGRQPWIAAALALAGAGYLYDLRRQTNPQSLQMALTKVGLQAMSLAIVYALLVVVGLG
jgi:hypothetical protein